jgi:selenocysteine-specific elongation factor
MNAAPPGLLPERANPDVVMMICTAGHVDHGKTSLVKLLTGCNTDTLKEEQERGLTIELGFAPCFLGNNLCVGIVDVPGHEKFIKNMVAGVSGIGLTVLVIAADDGVMPQTAEHVQIMELLGVRRGLVALTKIDLVSPERLSDCLLEIQDFLKGTFLAGAPICPVSSRTGDGYGEFYDTLVQQINSIVQQRRPGIFRMPIERVFVQSGAGTIVSGIPVDGRVEIGALLEVAPGPQTARVRGIQRFLRDADQGGQGQCLALNLPDLNKKPPTRGQVLSLPGYLKPAACFHLRLETVAGLKQPLRNAEEIKFHTGTIEAPGKLYLLEGELLGPGQKGLATIVLNEPVAAAVHDRFILRRPSPPATVAGGEVLALHFDQHRPRKQQILPLLKEFQTRFAGLDPATQAGLDRQVEGFLWWEQKPGVSAENIARGALLPLDTLRQSLSRLTAAGAVIALSDDHFVHPETLTTCLAKVETWIQQLRQEKRVLNLTAAGLRQAFPGSEALWKRIETELTEHHVLQRSGDRFVLPAAVEALASADRAWLEKLVQLYEETGYRSPRPEELPALLNATSAQLDRLLQFLFHARKLIRLSEHVVLSYSHFKKAQDTVVSLIAEKGVLNSADFKYHLDSSRKYALAILDFLDARRVTIRVGNDRKLAPDYRKQLM